MRLSYNWLTEIIDIPWSPAELADKLAMSGTDIEGVETIGHRLDKVVVGQILSIEQHPNADKLTVCAVDVGKEALSIVCGAKNMKVGDKVPVALVGAKLPGGMEIKQAKLRGVDSYGMMCSEVELGICDEAGGLMILEDTAVIGQPINEISGVPDVVIDCEITPNRADCMSVVGLAREAAALSGNKLRYPDVHQIGDGPPVEDHAKVEIENVELCPRYTAKVIRGVKIGPSPKWLQDKIIKAGFRPINNIVDVTNYIAVELGQPLHAFDYDKVKDHHIIVRLAQPGEKLLTLDDLERDLDRDMLVIADPSGAIAIAGVMGGAATEVNDDTTTVLLESAHFAPQGISRTSRRLGLISEASTRFERGVDPNLCDIACDRAMKLIAEVAGGTVLSGIIDVYPHTIEEKKVGLRIDRVNEYLGTALTYDDIVEILTRLEFEVNAGADGNLEVEIPTFRFDIEREVDLIEEVARIYGYNEISSTLPASAKKQGMRTAMQSRIKRLRDTLTSLGLDECVTYSFVDENDVKNFTRMKKGSGELIRLENPISEEMAVMRPTLLIGLMNALALNHSHDIFDIELFEIGKAFEPEQDHLLPKETMMLAGVLAGGRPSKMWMRSAREADYYSAKGIVEVIFNAFGIEGADFAESEEPFLHPSRQSRLTIDGVDIGVIGELSPELSMRYDLEGRIAVFEVDLSALLDREIAVPSFKEISKVPGMVMDVAVVVDDKVSAKELIGTIQAKGGELLRSVEVFDVYKGPQIPEGKKSLAFTLFLQAEDRSLTEAEVQKVREEIITALSDKLDAEIR